MGVTKVDSFVGYHSAGNNAAVVDPNLHGLWWGNYEATTCGIPVNTCSKNETAFGLLGGAIKYTFDGEASLTHDVLTKH